ncbi:MAG: hypothetical protein HC802_13585 [Caldilineaceae bacterium]|nr:hypothetical protein [Caldilineaceae bacterium]
MDEDAAEGLGEGSEWESLADATSESRSPETSEQTPVLRVLCRIYELALVFACIAAFVAIGVWWQIVHRVASLEEELLALRGDAATTLRTESEMSLPIVEAAGPGGSHRIETEFLRIEVDSPYVEITESIATEASQVYGQLRSDLGLAAGSTEPKIRVLVAPVRNIAESDPSTLLLTASALAASDGMNEEEALKRILLGQLVRRLFVESLADRNIKPQWRMMTSRLEHYLGRESGILPESGTPAYGVARRLAMLASSIGAVVEWEPDESAPRGAWRPEPQLYPSEPDPSASDIADTLIDFILTEYGYSIVPQLLDGFEQHDTWSTLAPAYFDMDEWELEAAWREFLQHEAAR